MGMFFSQVGFQVTGDLEIQKRTLGYRVEPLFFWRVLHDFLGLRVLVPKFAQKNRVLGKECGFLWQKLFKIGNLPTQIELRRIAKMNSRKFFTRYLRMISIQKLM